MELHPQIVDLLAKIRNGEPGASDAAYGLVNGPLQQLAATYLKLESSGHRFEPTALVTEAYVSLSGKPDEPWEYRTHFLTIASLVIGPVLIDFSSLKLALQRLTAIRPRLAYIARIRIVSGLNESEIATALETDTLSVLRDWFLAKAFLYAEARNDSGLSVSAVRRGPSGPSPLHGHAATAPAPPPPPAVNPRVSS
jgi:hypothetical protein